MRTSNPLMKLSPSPVWRRSSTSAYRPQTGATGSGRISKPVLAVAVVCLLGFVGLQAAWAQFASDNVALHAWLDLDALGGASNGNDCWGYVSATGREYALMGVSNKLVVVEITDPANPVIVGNVSHSSSLWADVKTYGDYCYVVNESGGGLDVVDLSDVDNGNVTLVQRVTEGGLSTSHNVAIDTDSGFLYLCGSNLNGGRLVAFNLSDPANPTLAGQMSSSQGVYVHDAEIVTYTSGPYAGRQIAFGANGGAGLDVYDVTAKGDMFRMSRTTYPNLSYAHQCWLSENRQYVYLNDELDSVNETVIFDVTDLANPMVVSSYNSGVSATDHNLYVRDSFIFEAEYRAGVRIFCADDPLNPVQVGWFDTYPASDGSGFDGAWSVYSFFPSGTVIVSDIQRGLFILDASGAVGTGTLTYAYPEGRPEIVNPQGGTQMRVEFDTTCGATAQAGTGMLHYDVGEGFAGLPMEELGDGVYEAVFPAVDCLTTVSYYVSAETAEGSVVTDPPDAPATTFSAVSASGQVIALADDFETDQGWTVENIELTDGGFDRGVPLGDGSRGDPLTDFDGSGKSYLTANRPGNSDVDGGPTRLVAPTIDLSGATTAQLTYARWFSNDDLDEDRLDVEISDDDGATWILIESVGHAPEWVVQTMQAADYVGLTSQVKVRFSTADNPNNSITEAAVDGFRVVVFECASTGDLDGDGDVDSDDWAILSACLAGPDETTPPVGCTPGQFTAADLDVDSDVDMMDFDRFQTEYPG